MMRTTASQIGVDCNNYGKLKYREHLAHVEIHKNVKEEIRIDSIKRRKTAFGATPQRHHVMPYGRLPRLPIHGNLLGGLGGHPLRVAHLVETNDATSLRLAVISATRLPEGPRSTRVRVGVPASKSRLSRRLQHHCSRGRLRRSGRGNKTRAPCLALGADLSRSTRSFLPIKRPSSGSQRCCPPSSSSRRLLQAFASRLPLTSQVSDLRSPNTSISIAGI